MCLYIFIPLKNGIHFIKIITVDKSILVKMKNKKQEVHETFQYSFVFVFNLIYII